MNLDTGTGPVHQYLSGCGTSTAEIGASPRLANVLEGIGANHVEDVLALTMSELESLRNFGDTSVARTAIHTIKKCRMRESSGQRLRTADSREAMGMTIAQLL